MYCWAVQQMQGPCRRLQSKELAYNFGGLVTIPIVVQYMLHTHIQRYL